MRVRLTRLSNHGNALRTPSVEGTLIRPVQLGLGIGVLAEPLDSTLDYRMVSTSPVVRIDGDNVWTENTHYLVEVLDDNAVRGEVE